MITAEEIKKLFSEVNSLEEARSLRKRLLKDIENEKSEDKLRDLCEKFNNLRNLIIEEYEKLESSYFENSPKIKEDLSVLNYRLLDYSFNPLEKVKDDLINFFSHLDFPIELGEEIVDSYDNFEILSVPKNHPSRSKSATFYLDGSDNKILRPHCTVSSVNYLFKKGKSREFKVAVLGSAYRRDDEDSTHIHQFTQLDFLWVKKGLVFSELKDFLESILKYLFDDNRDYRFRSSYFPFTKPSIEIDVRCICNKFPSCKICKGTGWIEVLGAGMLNKQILEKAGYSSEFECIAGGIGLERIALIRHEVWDIRLLYDNNFDFLKNRW